MATDPPTAPKGGAERTGRIRATSGEIRLAPKAVAQPGAQPGEREDPEAPFRLLQLEAEIRRLASPRELIFHMANESRAVMGFRQAFVLARRGRRWRVETVSSLANFDRMSPLIGWIERVAAVLGARGTEPATAPIGDLAKEAGAGPDYAFAHFLWAPLLDRAGRVHGGLLMAREQPWGERHTVLAARLAETYGHSWRALGGRRLGRGWRPGPWLWVAALGALIAATLLIRVPVSAIAPVEVVGRAPAVISAPLDGVIAEVSVAPNAPVAAGDLLARIEDTELRNAADIARQQVLVAEAEVQRLESGAFLDVEARRDIAIAKAELALARTERDLAEDRLSRVDLVADRAGVAIFASAQDLIGKPVAVGERIMEVADPRDVEYLIRLPVDDLIVVDPGMTARVFLDSDPLTKRPGAIIRVSYQAVLQDDGSMAYEMRAAPGDAGKGAGSGARTSPRIGARGTAQVLGGEAPLALTLFRRPLAWLRQTFGI